MKLKDKIKNKVDNNEALSLIKTIYNNKRYRSLLWMGLYFIFFAIIIVSLRSNYSEISNTDQSNYPNNNVGLNVEETLGKLNNYSYEILLNDEEIITGSYKNGTNTFILDDKNYLIVADNVYLENEMTLTKVDLTETTDLIIPINKITLNKLKEYIDDIEPIKENSDDVSQIKYNLRLNTILDIEDGYFELVFYGRDTIDYINIDLTDYVTTDNLEYENYILTIKLSD